MLHTTTTPSARRRAFRDGLQSDRLLRLPGAPNPLGARMIAEAGFEGVYVSGAVVAADLALPDVGLTTLTEVASRTAQITRVTDLPVLVDADTGFGEPLSAARTVQLLEDAGAAGCHVEDQENPKRCGHLAGKHVRPVAEMVRTVRAAVGGRRDPTSSSARAPTPPPSKGSTRRSTARRPTSTRARTWSSPTRCPARPTSSGSGPAWRSRCS